MINTNVSTGPRGPKPAPVNPEDNAAVANCVRAWDRAYRKQLPYIGKGESDWEAEKAGNDAYLRTMPPLAGFENIRDFIACVAYARIINAVDSRDAGQLFEAAKIALGALRHEPEKTETVQKKGESA